MRLLTARSKMSALALLGAAAAACSDGSTQTGPLTAAAAAQVAASAKPATLSLTVDKYDAPPVVGQWIMPSAFGWSVDVRGVDFPVGAAYESSILLVQHGAPVALGSSVGVTPADGSFRIKVATYCPSFATDLYVVVTSGGVTTTSKHIAPPC